MIAVFILSVGITAVLAMFPLGIQIVKSSEMATIGTQLAQEKIEEVISKPYASISEEPEETLDPPFSAYSRETEVTCFDPNGELSPNCPDTGIKKIKVIVSWGILSKKIELFALVVEK